MKIALSCRDVEPAVHGEHADVEAVELEGGAKALADCLGAERQGRQQPHLKPRCRQNKHRILG